MAASTDNVWLQVITAKAKPGWVKSEWVTVTGDLKSLAVTGKAIDAPDEALAYLSGITNHARQIFLAGQGLGNQADVFSKVGDSNTDNPAFLTPFDLGYFQPGAVRGPGASRQLLRVRLPASSSAAVGGLARRKGSSRPWRLLRDAAAELPPGVRISGQ